jgi:prolyl-tRNA editing enzyme YbaK/EbsC (Cys-tRNA(Pro) deacylase)/ribosomal protein S18 acetylase RimI-like enzyme
VAIDAWRTEVFDALLDAVLDDLPHDLFALVPDAHDDELARWAWRGFDEHRREDEYEIPVGPEPRAAVLPSGYVLVSAADADLDALRHLDEVLRQDVPGMRGWVNNPDEFAESTLGSALFDPATCLVAVEEATGVCAGLVRAWVARRWARLGLVGVLSAHRRQGLGTALTAAAFRPLPGRSVGVVLAEADVANLPAQALLARFGARRTGGSIELVRRRARPEEAAGSPTGGLRPGWGRSAAAHGLRGRGAMLASVTSAPALGTLRTRPALTAPELLAPPVTAFLGTWSYADRVAAAPIDPDLADTAAFVEAYGVPADASANCVVVAGRRDGIERVAACVVLATTRADVNGAVRRLLDVRKASFLSTDRAVEETAMEYGGITPVGLPSGWRVLVDARVAAVEHVVVGSGVRHSKLVLPGPVLAELPAAEIVEGLANPA